MTQACFVPCIWIYFKGHAFSFNTNTVFFKKWLRLLHLFLLMPNLCKIHHHSAEIIFFRTMLFPFRLSLWLSWVIPNQSPYLFAQVFLPSYQLCQENEIFFCINLFLFYVIATCTLYLSPVSFAVGVSFSVNSGIIYHQNNKYAFCQVFYFVQRGYLMYPNLEEKNQHGTADLFIYNVW